MAIEMAVENAKDPSAISTRYFGGQLPWTLPVEVARLVPKHYWLLEFKTARGTWNIVVALCVC